MNRIVAWFATNHVAANLLMGFAILAGLASLTRIPVKLYPDVDLPIITVTVEYLGAAPEEVESAASVMGFILALGLLVDDAVAVGESVYVSHRRSVGQLAGAIIMSVLPFAFVGAVWGHALLKPSASLSVFR